jgi:hypothetical protein
MSFLMSSLPQIAWADAAQEMIPTSVVVETLSHAQAQEKMRTYLDNSELKQAMIKRGISPDEVSRRVASLSDSELKQLVRQMDQARYGGDVTGVVILILLIVLIIYLIKRI